MELSFTIIFALVASAAVYLLFTGNQVRSDIALRWVFLDLAAAVGSFGLSFIIASLSESAAAALALRGVSFLFLAAAVLCIMLTVRPLAQRIAPPRSAHRAGKERFVDFAQGQDQVEPDAASDEETPPIRETPQAQE